MSNSKSSSPLSPKARASLDAGLKSSREEEVISLGSFAQYINPKREEHAAWNALTEAADDYVNWEARPIDIEEACDKLHNAALAYAEDINKKATK